MSQLQVTKERKLGGLKLLRSMLLKPRAGKEKKKHNFGRKIEPMTASHLGGICEEQMHFSVDRVTSTIKYIIYLYIHCLFNVYNYIIIPCNAQTRQ